jgi:hypothetical protein
MDFSRYIERTPENLQFYLWYCDYLKRFENLPDSERVLAPEWTIERANAEAEAARLEEKPKKVDPTVAAVLKGTDFDTKAGRTGVSEVQPDPFKDPPRTPMVERDSMAPSSTGLNDEASTLRTLLNPGKTAAAAFQSVEAPQPFTIQPFREEVTRIIAIYIAEGGARELNLSARERTAALKALSYTTHPSAFRDVFATVETSLRQQSHPNFIRWTICNGNRPRQLFARQLGVGGIVGGLLCIVLLTVSSAPRPWRIISAIGFFVGIATLFAAWKGMCVVLHGMHHRHLRPWELFSTEDDNSSSYDMKTGSFDSFGSGNSYEDEPWVAKYEKRNIIRKVFDREVWIQEPALRQIQDTIFLQAIIAAFIITAIIVGVFCAIPRGNKF